MSKHLTSLTNRIMVMPDVAAAYYLYQRKAFLLLRGERGDSAHQYVVLMKANASASLNAFLEASERAGLTVRNCHGADLSGKADVFSRVLLRADGLLATVDALVARTVGRGDGQDPFSLGGKGFGGAHGGYFRRFRRDAPVDRP